MADETIWVDATPPRLPWWRQLLARFFPPFGRASSGITLTLPDPHIGRTLRIAKRDSSPRPVTIVMPRTISIRPPDRLPETVSLLPGMMDLADGQVVRVRPGLYQLDKRGEFGHWVVDPTMDDGEDS